MTPYFQRDGITVFNGDVLAVLRELPSGSVHCVVTESPRVALVVKTSSDTERD